MSIVHLLDDGTVNKIAAGEVVERPASVVKELAENSIDAGATRIEVEIQGGGTSLIRVTDNGCGMGMEDARMAIQRHATSKIRDASDLLSIGTLGFRGEALPTIASVSRFSMRTRQEGSELGTLVRILGGREPEIGETGCGIGTAIQVEDLFFNTPARKKFLKTSHTEAGKVSECLMRLALSHPEIAFRLVSGNKAVLSTPGNGELRDAIRSIYGKQTADALLELDFRDTDLCLQGYITKPSMIRSSRSWQTFIVNGRTLQSRMLAKAMDNAYRSMVPRTGYPFAALILEVPQNSVDINVHPQKSEIKFEDEGRIFKAVYKAVVDAVRPAGQGLGQVAASVPKAERHYAMEPMQFIPAAAPAAGQDAPAVPPRTAYEAVSRGLGPSTEPMAFREAQRILHESPAPAPAGGPGPLESLASKPLPGDPGKPQPPAGTSPDGRGDAGERAALCYDGSIVPIGQVDLCYIIAQDCKGLYIVDQHAAHERILFDRLSAMADGIPSQQLLVHLVLEFAAGEARLLEEHQELLRSLGFAMEPSGEREFRLTEVPADIPLDEAEEIIREILADLAAGHRSSAKEIRQACLATTACRAAIKSGEELNLRQMQILLEELSRTAYPYTCPHGRPTILRFGSDELAKMFKRTGF